MTVILDSDPEVYRLGFGDKEALEIVRSASAKQYFDLREQPGVRIGVVISDEMTMIYSPISRTIEAGSTSKEKPNAIVLTGDAVDRIANASGAGTAENARQREVGSTALNPQKVHAMESNLKANPPKDFDLTRKLKVFSSKVQYVELSISNCRLTTRQVPLPPELIDLEDDDLKNKISSRIQMPSDDVGKIKIKLEEEDKPIEVDDNYLNKERKRIEDTYTYQVNNFGRMILQTDRKGFDEEIERFKKIINLYQEKLKIKVKTNEGAFISNIVKEFTPRWKKKAPENFERWKIEHNDENIEAQLKLLAQVLYNKIINFDPPHVKVQYKGVTLENIDDEKFKENLISIMNKKKVPKKIIDSLFESGDAVPEKDSFPKS